jgi:hypothetical protein
MATLGFIEPFYIGSPIYSSPLIQTYNPAPFAAFRRADFLALTTTGTIVTPPATLTGGTGALAGVAGPAASAVTFTQTVSAAAPTATYYVVITYTGTGAESAPSQEFIVNSQIGFVPTINVAAAGAPTGATGYSLYIGYFPGTEVRQSTAVALGTATTTTTPLANSIGVARAATNANANIVGMAVNSSAADYFVGTGGSFLVNEGSTLGATNSLGPLEPNEIFRTPVLKVNNGAMIEISLRQAYYPALDGTTAGLYLDPVTGFFVADNSQSNKILNILGQVPGVPSVSGNVGDVGARVRVQFNSGVI